MFHLAAELAWGADASGERQFLSRTRQISFEGKAGEGYFSPDGQSLVFQSVRERGNPFYQIYTLDLTSGDVARVSPGLGKTTCAFFQPGTDRLLFASTHHDPSAQRKQEEELAFLHSGKTRRYSWDYDDQMDVFTATRSGTELRRLTDAPGYDAEAAFSPDGRHIVFTSLRAAYPLDQLSAENRRRYDTDPAYFAEIFIMDADGSNQRRLTTSPGYDGGPFFTADGQRIVWRRFDTKGLIANVYTMNLDGSDVRQVTDFGSMSWAPFPHPSGKYFIFTSNKLGMENFELFLVDTDGLRQPVRISFTDGFDGLPVFSPDGRKLCWTSNRTADKQSQLFLAEWNHEAALRALESAPASAAVASPAPVAALSPEIRAEDIRQHVGILASDAFEGRGTGTPGSRKAADYLADQLRQSGVAPLPMADSYFSSFSFRSGVRLAVEANRLSASSSNRPPATFEVSQDFLPLSFSENGTAEGEVVFAGYGLSAPGKLGEGYDSYAGLDVTNKIVLALRYVPENVAPARRQELNRYAALRYKAMLARERGAKAILIVSGPNSPNAGDLIPLSSDGTAASSGILAATISARVAEALLAGTGRTLQEFQTALDTDNPHANKGEPLPGARVRLALGLEHERKEDRNVLGAIPGRSSEYILVGAHYDHLGHGEESGSRAGSHETREIHNGADDNASGVSVLLELAASFATPEARAGLPRGLIFGFWSGEEMGLLGSAHFAEHPPFPLTNIVGYLNFDMVGRLRENKLVLQGVKSSPAWQRLIEKRNIAAGFDLTLQDDPYLPTDTTSFYPKGIPVLAFFTGSHDDYHRPTDDPPTLDYDGTARIGQFARGMLADLSAAPARPEYVKVEQSNPGGQRDNLRAYLGTIPDYATEDVKGVKLSGVRPGSPAEKAGLQGGDIITEFAGQKIANIYDYTYALDAVKIGQPIQIVVTRAGQPVPVTATPVARK